MEMVVNSNKNLLKYEEKIVTLQQKDNVLSNVLTF